MSRVIYILLLCLWSLNSHAWNMQGHKVVAQIAYDNLTSDAKNMCHKYLNTRRKKSPDANFLAASIWADQIKFKNINWYSALHYIDIPFSTDGSPLFAPDNTNAVRGIKQAVSILSAKKTNVADKRLALRLLIHVVGDIHQPLHAATRVSSQLPQGDLGGNLFLLGANDVGGNLHQYWDKGAGFFAGRASMPQIQKKACILEKKWPCSGLTPEKNPEQWAQASHNLAVNQVYQINPKEVPGKQYQLDAQNAVEKQVAIAGCQLAGLLNDIAKKHS